MKRLSLLGVCIAVCVAGDSVLVAQEDIGFKPVPSHDLSLPALTDADVTDLLATSDVLLARQADPAKWGTDAKLHLWRLLNRLQAGVLSTPQQTRVAQYFDGLIGKHPGDRAFLAGQQELVRTRLIGMTAPDIVGKDYDGKEFHLSDYRGQVVVVVFSGEWCGPCRGEYPFQRLLLELYKDRPFTVLSVNSDSSLDVAKKAKVDHALTYRSWWDGYGAKSTAGPIASAWGVTGWPTIYVLDETGAIRFVNLRQEDLVKGVRQLMSELATKTAAHKK